MQINIQFDSGSRPFLYREQSVGDRGVVKQIFVNRDYNFMGWPQGRRLMAYHNTLKRSATPLVVDAGANIGASAVWFLSFLPGCFVFAVEPAPGNFELLERNTMGFKNCLNYQGALSNQDGELILSDPDQSDWGFRTSPVTSPAEHGLRVPSICPNTILADPRLAHTQPLIMKIDIEGGEDVLFSGDVDWMGRFALIIIELHDWLLPFSGCSRNFLRAVVKHDFDLVHRGENIFLFNRKILA